MSKEKIETKMEQAITYYEAHKEQRKIYQKNYHQKHKDDTEYMKGLTDRKTKWIKENRDRWNAYQRERYKKMKENSRKQSEWISVDERLPESGVHCILCCDMKRIDGTHSQYVCDGYFAERWKINAHYADDDCATEYNEEDDEYYLKVGWYEVIKNWDDYNSIVIDDTVTHWMPLPEAPKKGGE